MKRHSFLAVCCLFVLSCCARNGGSPDAATEPADPAAFIGAAAFARTELLPFLRFGVQTRQFCSYDRAGDNYDAEYLPLYTDTNGECVIFDAMGPGCLYRQQMNLWHDKPIFKGINIRYYFDEEPEPRIDMDVSTFFSAQNPLGVFRPPLGFDGKTRFRVLYHPMFFKRRLKVALSAEPGGPGTAPLPWAGRYNQLPNRRNHWYQYTYHLYAEDPGLPSWTPEQGLRAMPALSAAWDRSRLGQDPKPQPEAQAARATAVVKAGRTARLWRIRGAGSIAALHLKLEPADSEALFDTWLKIAFDDASVPQVEAPVGAFFGMYRTSLQSTYSSLLLGCSTNGGYCFLPMPFWKSATIELENRGRKPVAVEARLTRESAVAMPYPRARCGYFHAQYHREDPRVEGKDYSYLERTGSGHVVGHVVARWRTSMEENERTYFDGSRTPWIMGDGFEDDHNMGWGLQNLSEPVFGAVGARGGSGGIYRFFLPDAYVFHNGIKQGHQTYGPHTPLGHEGMYQAGTEESVTFLYAIPRPCLIQTDALDVGNAESERAHAYTALGDVQRSKGEYWYDGEFNNVLFKTPAIADDGVSFTRSSTFRIALSPRNRGIRLRRRTDKANNRQRANVFIDGRLVTERPWYSVDHEKTYRGIRWFDSDYDVPAAYTKGKREVNVRLEFVSSATGRWDEYFYWIYSYLPQ